MTEGWNALFRAANEVEEMKNCEAIENLVSKNIHKYVMGKDADEIEKDKSILLQIKLHRDFLTPEMLEYDSKRLDERHMNLARDELQNLNEQKSTIAKLRNIINASMIVAQMLKKTNKQNEPDGADVFVPTMVLLMMRLSENAASKLQSNALFVRNFRHPANLSSEDDYYLTMFQSVIDFIHDLSHKDLTISE